MLIYLSLLLFALFLFIFFYTQEVSRPESEAPADTRRFLRPNATDYNISMMDPERIDQMSKSELEQLLHSFRANRLSSLSLRDFYHIRRRLSELEE